MKANKTNAKLKPLAFYIQDKHPKLMHVAFKALPLINQQHQQAQPEPTRPKLIA